jgi:hypothetical protein
MKLITVSIPPLLLFFLCSVSVTVNKTSVTMINMVMMTTIKTAMMVVVAAAVMAVAMVLWAAVLAGVVTDRYKKRKGTKSLAYI